MFSAESKSRDDRMTITIALFLQVNCLNITLFRRLRNRNIGTEIVITRNQSSLTGGNSTRPRGNYFGNEKKNNNKRRRGVLNTATRNLGNWIWMKIYKECGCVSYFSILSFLQLAFCIMILGVQGFGVLHVMGVSTTIVDL